MDVKGRILVVEDDTLFCQLLSTALVKAGYDAMAVPDGLTALEVLDWYHPNAIFLDMYLPTFNGWDFLEKYRDLPTPRIPVIASSATNVDPESLQDVVGFIPKPFRIPRLIQIIENAMVPS